MSEPATYIPKPPVQYLTAVFELRPTRRKAAALERVRATAEAIFWNQLERHRATAMELTTADRKTRRAEAWRIEAEAARQATSAGLVESVAAGIARDIGQAIGSFVGLVADGHEAAWPERPKLVTPTDRPAALLQLASSTSIEDERHARDELARIARGLPIRPFVLVRSRDCQLVRDGTGRIAAILNVLRAKDGRSREANINGGFDATTGEIVNTSKRKSVLVVPVGCSRWHENKFLSGKARLKSALILRRAERWFMCAQFEFTLRPVAPSGRTLGIDRGCVHPAVAAVVEESGAVLAVPQPAGTEIGAAIELAEQRRRREQRRRGWSTLRHVRAVDDGLHRLANEIVALAKRHTAEVVFERLGELKRSITAPRAKGVRKGGWRKVLKKAQLGKLEQLLAYKLPMAGLATPRDVLAAGTSQTCAACGHREAANRADRDTFTCKACGYSSHADSNAAIIIARRGVMARSRIPKGARLDALHMNMVEGLRARDDGGLGPLASCRRVVAAHASASVANDLTSARAGEGLTSETGQDVSKIATENALPGVLAERGGRILSRDETTQSQMDSGSSPRSGAGDPSNAG
ncbi:MAG: transposase [Acidobacteria bacterium]|nr:transposase [Acidobacteriota bacterium]